jgi:hypothetical protein
MRRFLIILVFIILTVGAYGQSYQSVFGKNSTTWSIKWHNLDFTTSSDFFVSGDTIINSLSYKSISVNNFGKTGYFLREDTLTGKIWLVNLNPQCYGTDTAPRLEADLSLQLGDTFNISLSQLNVTDPADSLIVVDSVYYVAGQKQIRFTSPPSIGQLPEPITFIEGIGPNYSLMWLTGNCDEYIGKYLLCVFKDSVEADYTNLRFNGECSPNFAGIPTVGIADITIYPNPAREYLDITGVLDSKTECAITNVLGQVLGHYSLISGSNNINIGDFASGYYQISFYLNGGKIGYQKFIKVN